MHPLVEKYKAKLPHESFARVKRHWLSIAFVCGFIVDNITLNNVEQLFDNVILFTYVVLSMGGILMLYAGMAGKLPEKWTPYVRAYVPLLVQYAFGGLLSGMLIFYGRSGAWAESWPFLLIILGVIAGNEIIKDRAGRFLFNLAVLFIGLFSYTVLIVPVVSGYMGPWVFIGSGVLSLVVMAVFVRLLRIIIPNFVALQMRTIVFLIGTIFAIFNFLYFANIIPPIPLSLKDVGIYHSVVKFEGNEYQLKYEKGEWWQPWKRSDSTFHPTNGGIYCFAAVFAPTRLSTDIYHRWEYYDEAEGEWIDHARLSYQLPLGAREGGYRGYTLIENYRDGTWRCNVETERGQVLGRETFVVDSSQAAAELVTRTE